MNFESNRSLAMSLAIFAAFFTPHNAAILTAFQVFILLWLGSFFKSAKLTGASTKKAFYPFLLIVLCSFAINVFNAFNFSIKDLFANAHLVLLLLLFPYARTKISFFSVVFLICIIFLLSSQLAYAYNIQPLVIIFDSLYSYTGEVRGYQSEFLLSGAGDSEFMSHRRYGGLYHNPNQAMKYMTLLYAAVLVFWVRGSVSKFALTSSIVFLSVVLSGSRTAFVVYATMLVYYYLANLSKSSFKIKLGGGVAAGSILVGVFVISDYLGRNRIFSLTDGIEESIGAKFGWLVTVLKEVDTLNLLFGHFWRGSIERYSQTLLDSEWGYIIFDFGLLGLICWGYAIVALFVKCPKEARVIFVFLLWAVSSTVLMSYRTSFVFFFLLSMCMHYASHYTGRKL